MNPLVSIIIPVYNAEKLLAIAIESAINQSYSNCELLIIDDGSTDQSFFIAQKYISDQVRIIKQDNKGASAARNHGINRAKGDYIQFLDADDFLHQDKIRLQLELIEEKDDTLGLGPTAYFNDGENLFSPTIEKEWFSDGTNNPVDFLTKLYGARLVGENYGGMIQPNSWLVPKSLIEKAGPWNEELTLDDDGEFFCRVILASKGIVYAQESINYYRKFKSNDNLSSLTTDQAFRSAIKSTQLKYSHLSKKLDQKLLDKIFSRLYWAIAVELYPKNLKLYKEVKKIITQLNKDKITGYYTHTPFYRFVTKYFGWKTSAWISFIKHGK
ncbi:glycosyltransferase family 2 protein [Pedobacter fastidiosus]|uniref:Glycosyltransferase family 2 protein n=1 Tax=Pedobacter fastidiosus TaxID=2765361 RepID=A0ABR7KVM7_9SPHI|nr:glycosyltransferase family 2 protein [Pedobacter fastidiosus]MBC6112167.1 glycosyltransferase family 2 protein [Pedobacter fastidiosus]